MRCRRRSMRQEQVDALPTLAQTQAEIAAAFASHNAPAIAAEASVTVQAIVAARAANSHFHCRSVLALHIGTAGL
jgi:hypothetical protein